MKSPPFTSVGFTFLQVFDSVFKEYSDPGYLRSDVIKLCDLPSGGISTIIIAPLLNNYFCFRQTGASQPPALGTTQAEYLPLRNTSKPDLPPTSWSQYTTGKIKKQSV